VQHQDGVGPISVERPKRLVGDAYVGELTAQLERDASEVDELTVARVVPLLPGGAGRRGRPVVVGPRC
jgi:hypothetical protein